MGYARPENLNTYPNLAQLSILYLYNTALFFLVNYTTFEIFSLLILSITD